jgi:protein-tyrosine phosphatase
VSNWRAKLRELAHTFIAAAFFGFLHHSRSTRTGHPRAFEEGAGVTQKDQNENAPLLLFVCSGNICRSPMAVAIAASAAERAGIALRAQSCGTMALVDDPAESVAHETVAELGLSLHAHRARQATAEMLRDAALVVGLTRLHRRQLAQFAPDLAERIVSFDELTGLGDIPDPYGSPPGFYRRVRDTLVEGMPAVLAEFKARIERSANNAQAP